ncbi:MAG: DUF6629 family protein [Anderseniella sp.]|nr:DUF6629 family protein [Anderseniella sp.]
MCFSATASFTLAAALVPAGIVCVRYARSLGMRWMGFAVFPFAFAAQQGLEGLVWLGLDHGKPALVDAGAAGFLFFSHLFWPIAVPVSVHLFHRGENPGGTLLAVMMAAGVALGLVLFAPVASVLGSIPVDNQTGSIRYELPLMLPGEVARLVLKLVYVGIIAGALGLSSDRRIQGFGGLIAVSLVAAEYWFAPAFISVWCFFAAVLSLYILAVLVLEARKRPGQVQPFSLH